MRPQTVLMFDLGGVLVESAGRYALRTLVPHLNDDSEVLAKWHMSQAVSDFERGRSTPQLFAEAFIADWGLELSYDSFLCEFTSWVKGFYPGAQHLLAELRPKYRLACLSNTNCLHWTRLQDVVQCFDYAFASFQSGVMKPDLQAYKAALTSMQVNAADVHFFDDLKPNIEAAEALGIHAYQVAGVAETRAALQEAGLLNFERSD